MSQPRPHVEPALDHVVVRASDAARARWFYADVIGLPAHPADDSWLRIGNDAWMRVIEAAENEIDGRTRGVDHDLALRVDFAATVPALVAAGYRPYQPWGHGHVRPVRTADDVDHELGHLYVRDDDGHVIALIAM